MLKSEAFGPQIRLFGVFYPTQSRGAFPPLSPIPSIRAGRSESGAGTELEGLGAMTRPLVHQAAALSNVQRGWFGH